MAAPCARAPARLMARAASRVSGGRAARAAPAPAAGARAPAPALAPAPADARGVVCRAAGDEDVIIPAKGAEAKKEGGKGGRPQRRGGNRRDRKSDEEQFEERVVSISRVTKVVKGGKKLSFRAVVVVGNGNGKIGVGCSKAAEVITAVQKAVIDAKKNMITPPMNKDASVPHEVTCKFKACNIHLTPASQGSGVKAGGATRTVLELAGYKNVSAKQLGSGNLLNNARCTIKALTELESPEEHAARRNMTVSELFGKRDARAEVAMHLSA